MFIETIKNDGEEWRDVSGYEGFYMVSSMGRVVSLGGETYRGGRVVRREPTLLNPSTTRGYKIASLCVNGAHKTVSVHRLVAQAFIPNQSMYPEIDHINGDRGDNRKENLRWCTHSMNMLNEITREKNTKRQKGGKRPSLWKAVVQLRNGTLVNRFDSLSFVKKMGFDVPTIVQICRYGGRKIHKGYEWMYEADYLERERRRTKYRKR